MLDDDDDDDDGDNDDKENGDEGRLARRVSSLYALVLFSAFSLALDFQCCCHRGLVITELLLMYTISSVLSKNTTSFLEYSLSSY